MEDIGDIAADRLPAEALARGFADIHPALTPAQAVAEASRCYFCYDAPCIQACPTGIDIPSFIRKIFSGNLRGSAQTILESNILGGSCARVCPTEILCEQACVHTAQDHQPIRIGDLQRHAVDWQMLRHAADMAAGRPIAPFIRAAPTGKRIAVVGAGPAGLACAHALAKLGHAATIFEAREKPGGLNEYGIAAYKLTDAFAAREVDFILSIGGIDVVYGQALGRDISLEHLRREFDAVFLGLGLAGVNDLGFAAGLPGVLAAVDFIAEIRQSDKDRVAVGRRVVVIGGGNTAIDAAVQARRLGAEEVTIVYRRGSAAMSATGDEQAWAKANDVRIQHWAAPVRLLTEGDVVTGLECARTEIDSRGAAGLTGRRFVLPADMVLTAIGQRFLDDPLGGALRIADGRIAVDDAGRTSLAGVYAGGDCVTGPDLTVAAVQDGKRAAADIHQHLGG